MRIFFLYNYNGGLKSKGTWVFGRPRTVQTASIRVSRWSLCLIVSTAQKLSRVFAETWATVPCALRRRGSSILSYLETRVGAPYRSSTFRCGDGLTHSRCVSNSKKSLKHVRLASVRIFTPWWVRDESALHVSAPWPPNTHRDVRPSPARKPPVGIGPARYP